MPYDDGYSYTFGLGIKSTLYAIHVVTNSDCVVHQVLLLDCALSLNCMTQDNIALIKRHSTQFGVSNFWLPNMSHAHAQSNDRI